MSSDNSIAILIDDYLPESIKVASKMMHELAIELKERGFHVDVYTPIIVTKDRKKANKLNLQIDGINVFKFNAGRIKNAPKPLRLINELLMPYWLLFYYNKELKNKKYQMVVSYSPSIFWYPVIRFLKKISPTKSFLVLRDFFPQWVIDNGMIKESSLIGKFLRWHEFKCYYHSDRIGIQSPANLNWFHSKFPNFKEKTTLLYNWASVLAPNESKTEANSKSIEGSFRNKYKLESKLIFFYGGNIGHAQDMKNLLQLAIDMRIFQNVFFIFMGSGDEVDVVKKTIETEKLDNTMYLEPVSQEEFTSVLKEMNVGLFSLNVNHTTHNFPGKILAYCQLGIPILGAVNMGNDIIDVIENNEAGKVSIAGDREKLFANAKMMMDEIHRDRMAENAKKLMQSHFSTKHTADLILENI